MDIKILSEIIKNSLKEVFDRRKEEVPENIRDIDEANKDFLNLTEIMTKTFLKEEENEKQIKQKAVRSIFNHLNGNSEKKFWPITNLTERLEERYPNHCEGEWDEEQFRKMLHDLSTEWNTYRADMAWINSFFDILEEKAIYIPDMLGNEEISLYEHVKSAAAVGSCLYETGWEKEKIEIAKEVFLLFSMDLSGIQDFIYTITSKGALKSLRARSFYLEIMMENMADTLLDSVGLSRANLVYSGGGHCYILFPNTKKIQNQITDYMKKMNQWFFDKFQVDLYVGYGMTACSLSELLNKPEGSYADVFRRISNQISDRKMRRYGAEEILFLNHSSEGEGKRECKICKRTDHLDLEDYCEICGSLLRFSKNILSQEYFSVISEKKYDGLPLPDGKYLVFGKISEAIRIYRKNKADTSHHMCIRIWMGDYTGADTFEELAEEAEGIKRLAVFRADVDNLGTAFVKGFHNSVTGKNESSLVRTASLSKHLSLFFKNDINDLLKEKKVAIVYSGGDDLFLVGAWSDIIEAALEIQKSLERFSQNTLTISGGIGLYQSTFPIHVMAKEVEELEDTSKSMPDKNAITLFHEESCFSWMDFREKVIGEKFQAIEEYFTITKEHGKNFLYHLLELLENHRKDENDKISLVRYVYLLSRMEPEDDKSFEERRAYQRFSKKMYDWMQDQNSRKELILAIYLYVYKVREREKKYGKEL